MCKPELLVQMSSDPGVQIKIPSNSSQIQILELLWFFIWNTYQIWRTSYRESCSYLQTLQNYILLQFFSKPGRTYLDWAEFGWIWINLNSFTGLNWQHSKLATHFDPLSHTRWRHPHAARAHLVAHVAAPATPRPRVSRRHPEHGDHWADFGR
jgi:hypothetical protein